MCMVRYKPVLAVHAGVTCRITRNMRHTYSGNDLGNCQVSLSPDGSCSFAWVQVYRGRHHQRDVAVKELCLEDGLANAVQREVRSHVICGPLCDIGTRAGNVLSTVLEYSSVAATMSSSQSGQPQKPALRRVAALCDIKIRCVLTLMDCRCCVRDTSAAMPVPAIERGMHVSWPHAFPRGQSGDGYACRYSWRNGSAATPTLCSFTAWRRRRMATQCCSSWSTWRCVSI